MNKEEIIKYLKKELDCRKEYIYLTVDMRDENPRLFQAWEKKEKIPVISPIEGMPDPDLELNFMGRPKKRRR